MKLHIKLKRVYEKPEASDGIRVLVDRIWPRGVSKREAALDEWMRELAPSHDLRRWFGHEPDKFGPFAAKYKKELSDNKDAKEKLDLLRQWAREGMVTLVYAAKDEQCNQAVVLKELLTSG